MIVDSMSLWLILYLVANYFICILMIFVCVDLPYPQMLTRRYYFNMFLGYYNYFNIFFGYYYYSTYSSVAIIIEHIPLVPIGIRCRKKLFQLCIFIDLYFLLLIFDSCCLYYIARLGIFPHNFFFSIEFLFELNNFSVASTIKYFNYIQLSKIK